MVASNGEKEKDHVKKPLNAYFIWCRLFRKQILQQNPKITIPKANILLGKIWNEMSMEQQKPYFKESERIKKQHRVDYPEFQSKAKPRVKDTNKKKYETVMKSSEIGDINNRYYQMSQMVTIPSGQIFWPITQDVPEKTMSFCTSGDPSNKMQLGSQQVYMDAKSCTQEPIGCDGDIPEQSMLSDYQYQHHDMQMGPQENLHESNSFEVTSTELKHLSTLVSKENSPPMVVRNEGISSTDSKTLPRTFDIISNQNTICVQQSEPKLFKEQPIFSNGHLSETRPKCNPVIMTSNSDKEREFLALPLILAKPEGTLGTFEDIPEQDMGHFDSEYSDLEYNYNDSSRSENSQTLPLSQARNETIENTQLLVEDAHLNTQMFNTNILLGTEDNQNGPISEQAHEEDQPLIISDLDIIDASNTTLNQSFEEHINQADEYISDIFKDNDFGSVDGDTECLSNLDSCFWSGDFSSINILNEEAINVESLSELPCMHISDDNPFIDSFKPTCEFCEQIRFLMSESAQDDLIANAHNGWTLLQS